MAIGFRSHSRLTISSTMSESENNKSSSPSKDEAASGGGRKVEHLPPGLHHHVVPTERAGAFNVYVQASSDKTARLAIARQSSIIKSSWLALL